MTTLNLRAMQLLEHKINERLELFKDEVFDSGDFSKFKEYCGRREGLQLALYLCEEVERELNS